ncbi:RDD family protein [Paenibacillus tepidiphilus]|uniref:RDD family protein n=1 Tax=Paenibacillus tepidiphilus TaxID=2608683 RepID=UPI001238FA5A|nr:RDD family protein [Paenibacillus tepidiphilus]
MQAGFWIRFGAALLDGIIIGIPLGVLSYIMTGDTGNDTVSDIFTFLYSTLLPVFWRGYTVGKRLCGIQIRRVSDHSPPGIGTMLLRNVAAGIVYAVTLGIGVIVSAFMVGLREDKRSLHDFLAGTEVVQS